MLAHHNTWAASWAGWSGQYRPHISWAVARPGPSNFERMGRGPPGSSIFQKGRSPARPIKIQRMGGSPAQPITFSNVHGPARPGPSIFLKSRPGPARPITFSKVSVRPDPARHKFQIGPARPGRDKRPTTSSANISIHVIPSSLVSRPAANDVSNLSPWCTSSTTSFYRTRYPQRDSIPFSTSKSGTRTSD